MMRIWLLAAGMVLTGCAGVGMPDPAPENPLSDRGWTLVWADEFDGGALNRTKWAPEVSCWGGGNKEHQCYVDRPETISVADGYLTLTARAGEASGPSLNMDHADYPGPPKTQPYTSGKLRTRDLAHWTYGRIEGRMRLPKGQGAWPAFWMMPQFDAHGGWPLSGEIDIMEAVNLGSICEDCDARQVENRTSGAVHFGERPPLNVHISKRRALTSVSDQMGAPHDQFHAYAIEWAEGRIDWFVDGERFWTATASEWFTGAVDKDVNPNAPFDEAFYVMLNFAVGGHWPEGANAGGIDPTAFPAALIVDYVRVYQCTPDPATGLACLLDD